MARGMGIFDTAGDASSSMPFMSPFEGSGSTSPLPTSGNQYGALPPMQTPQIPPGIVPQQGTPSPLPGGANSPWDFSAQGSFQPGANPYETKGTHGYIGMPTLDPGLTGSLFNYLQSQIGTGVTPFNLSSVLPTGGTTDPGSLTAPLNPILSQLMQFYNGGQSNVPGMQGLSQISQGISAIPAWQDAVKSMQQNIQQQQANLKEQFGSAGGGSLEGTPFANAMGNFQSQTTADLNSLLANMQLQTLPQQLGASDVLASGATGLGNTLQSLNQGSIQNLYNEFLRTSPQSNPLLNAIFGASTTFPPYLSQSGPAGSGVGAFGGLMQGAGSLLGGIGSLIPGMGGAAAGGAAAGGEGVASTIASLLPMMFAMG